RNDFGFVPRSAVRKTEFSGGIKPRPRSGPIREVAPQFETNYVTDQLGRLLTRTHRAAVNLNFHSGDTINVTRTMNFEHLDSAFPLRSNLVIPIGDYAFSDWDLGFQTSKFRSFYGSGGLKIGDFWDGENREYRAGLGVRHTGHFSTDISW